MFIYETGEVAKSTLTFSGSTVGVTIDNDYRQNGDILVVFPASHDGTPITNIGVGMTDLFDSNSYSYPVHVVLPKTITSITAGAFGMSWIGYKYKIYWEGTEVEWTNANIAITNKDDSFDKSKVVFYSNRYRDGCWHWDDNKPVMW